jgi:hypothetical protein
VKVSYNNKDDVLIYEIGTGKIDHAQEMGPFIVHFDRKGKAVLLEMLDASDFLTASLKATKMAKNGKKVEL